MSSPYANGKRNWTAAIIVAAAAGLCYWWLSRQETGLGGIPRPAVPPALANSAMPGAPKSPPGTEAPATVTPDPVATRYVQAYQAGDWDAVIDLTCWMQERLMYVQAHSSDPGAREAERARLREELASRPPEGNLLAAEGIDDKYVFAPEAAVKTVFKDEGNTDLERPVASRTWFEVTYPQRETALRDEQGLPAKSITVGVSVSTDGFVLKANVIGNLDVDADSVSYAWNTGEQGG